MKTIKIYDYADNVTECELSDKDISCIVVDVWSGDEVVLILYEDGTSQGFDSSDDRTTVFDDGRYVVSGDLIDKWIAFEPSKDRTASYERLDAFT